MLRSLNIRDIVLIEALDLEFDTGLNVLTGETGAGKSILLDALGFALGRKVRRNLIRSGAEKGSVTAAFVLAAGHPALDVLEGLGINPDGNELIVRRVLATDGPSRAFVNDQRISAEALRRLGEALVEVHGQHDDRGLLNPRAHRPLLDTFAGIEAGLTGTREAWRHLQEISSELVAARTRITEVARDADFLRHALDELRELAPQAGEDDALDAERRLIKQAEKIRDEVVLAARLLSPEGAEGTLGDALSRLTHAAERAEGRLDPPIEALDRAMEELGTAQRGVEDALSALTFDPGRLEELEERLFAIRGLARKHDVRPDDLTELAEAFKQRLEEVDAGGEHLAELEGARREAEKNFDAAAESLSRARRSRKGTGQGSDAGACPPEDGNGAVQDADRCRQTRTLRHR